MLVFDLTSFMHFVVIVYQLDKFGFVASLFSTKIASIFDFRVRRLHLVDTVVSNWLRFGFRDFI